MVLLGHALELAGQEGEYMYREALQEADNLAKDEGEKSADRAFDEATGLSHILSELVWWPII